MECIRNFFLKIWRIDFVRRHLLWCLGFGLLGSFVLGKYLFNTDQVLSHQSTDTFSQLIYTYQLGFEGLRNGTLVYWNPYNYGGQPFLGQMQSALLYIPNWLVVFMPISMALNWLIFGHQWLLALGIYGWGTSRGLRPAAAFAAGALMMFCAPYMLHIYSGHIPHLCCMAWAPFVFWGIDGWLKKRDFRWLLLSAAAAAMQIYAGHPQYFYYTAIVAGVYSLVFLRRSPDLLHICAGLIAIYPLALLFSAAQFIPGLSAASESVRSGGTNFEFASMFGLPPENLMTFFSPWLFGEMSETAPYWGRCYLWEMSLFFGAGGLLLFIYGLAGEGRERRIRYGILMAVVLLLALGAHTPLYSVLYHTLPGFSMFRGTSKFGFFLVLFMTLLAGHGVNRLFSGEKVPAWLWKGSLGVAIVLGLMGAGLYGVFGSWFPSGWESIVKGLSTAKESYVVRGVFDSPDRLASAVRGSRDAFLLGAVWLAATGGLLWAVRREIRLTWSIVGLVILEVMIFAGQSVASFPLEATRYTAIKDFLKNNQGDYRTLNLINPESAIELKSEGIWGYDPFVLKRYAEFVAFTQKQSPDEASQYVQFRENSPLLAMLRARLAFMPAEEGKIRVQPLQDPMPRFFMVANYRVLKTRDEIFAEMSKPGFNPRAEVLLEERPNVPADSGTGEYQVKLFNTSTDHWTLEVINKNTAFLVMTDAYSKDWRVKSLPGSVQVNYQLLPAYYTLRAIPLSPGVHRIRIEYVPSGLALGTKLTLLGLVVSGLFLFVPVFRNFGLRCAVKDTPAVVDEKQRKQGAAA